MKLLKGSKLAVLLLLSSINVYADTITTLSVGVLPTSIPYSNTFVTSSSGTTFWDDYIFTVPDSSANSVTTSLNLDSILGLSNLRARIYSGSTHQTGAVVPGTLVEGWGATVNYSPTVGLTAVVLNTTLLASGTYTLQIKGDVVGSAGGSYTGVLNLAPPIPEPETYALLLAGLGLVAGVSRISKKK